MRPSVLRFHAVGNWERAQVKVMRVASSWHERDVVRGLIESAWVAATARPGVFLFDGPMCRLESWEASAGRLGLKLSDTTYKRFLGTNLMHPELAEQYGPAALANPVG